MKIGNRNLTVNDIPKVLFVIGSIAIMATVPNFSWITILLFSLLTFSLIAGEVSQKLRRQTCQRVFKYMIACMFICAISFSAFQNYAFRNAGHPTTFDPAQPDVTIAYPNILNASITEILQGIKNTSAFSLLSVEYPGENTLLYMELNTASAESGGTVTVRFIHATKYYIYFASHSGRSYDIHARRWWNSEFPTYIQPQTVDNSLQQMDDLGLQWFYDRTIEECQKKSEDGLSQIGTNAEITDLHITIMWDEFEDYQGLTLKITCFFKDPWSRSASFTAVFQPDGTLLSGAFKTYPQQ